MTTTIGLIRHGITEWNSLGKAQGISNIPLNEEGLAQAIATAKRVYSEQWDFIYSSDLIRALQTAEVISNALGINSVTTDYRLREIYCGQIEGTTEEERIMKWGTDWRLKSLGMEPFEEVAKRGIDFVREVSIKYPNKRILIISHGVLIGLTLQHLFPKIFNKTNIKNTSITIIKLNEREWECVLFNCTKHLE
ncbi:histidine phosphatase family protein [Paenibacillus xylanexedens]|uniref:histidine phosphatase family protein n=1 Tax=Paenibacillus xylanexedens TaxID=528191 RepID=UPI00119CDD03|nr:histidine phosphatase family protein [Paenibacillus xylanexedens]